MKHFIFKRTFELCLNLSVLNCSSLAAVLTAVRPEAAVVEQLTLDYDTWEFQCVLSSALKQCCFNFNSAKACF